MHFSDAYNSHIGLLEGLKMDGNSAGVRYYCISGAFKISRGEGL